MKLSNHGRLKAKQHNPHILLLSTIAVLIFSFFFVYYYVPLSRQFQRLSQPSMLTSYDSSSLSSLFSPPFQFMPQSPKPSRVNIVSSSPPPPSPSIPPPSPPPPVGVTIIDKVPGLPKECDVSKGEWIHDPKAPYYTNTTCGTIQEHQNCLKYGRPDTEFMKWRWKPVGCELPKFDPKVFLEVMRGKSLAFVGDSLARNQMQSLMCLLSRVEYPKDVSQTSDDNFKRMLYETYDFIISIFWSPFLVHAEDPPIDGEPVSQWRVHLDKVDRTWFTHIHKFDFLIISSGNWFTRPSLYFQRRKPIGCNYCKTNKKIRRLTLLDANKNAFRTAFRAIISSNKFKGTTVLRTLSPSHFEGGQWNKGGDCRRTKPYKRDEIKMVYDDLKLYEDQIKELKKAETVGNGRGLKFRSLDATQAMLMRPDGHPSRFGHWPDQNVTLYNDCVHWCLPGPIDLWNDLLLQIVGTN